MRSRPRTFYRRSPVAGKRPGDGYKSDVRAAFATDAGRRVLADWVKRTRLPIVDDNPYRMAAKAATRDFVANIEAIISEVENG